MWHLTGTVFLFTQMLCKKMKCIRREEDIGVQQTWKRLSNRLSVLNSAQKQISKYYFWRLFRPLEVYKMRTCHHQIQILPIQQALASLFWRFQNQSFYILMCTYSLSLYIGRRCGVCVSQYWRYLWFLHCMNMFSSFIDLSNLFKEVSRGYL